ncbi:replication initiator protein A [Paraclostridium bifermentans]|uniref:replication initiator protein A n=1 Tax=Paraclostridium bifermentans TaxID=1490 RepID=UPI001C0FE5E8|nr:replication initiator protein A [Paraclostridium bifermentans]MBU5290097.1 replication initiator protein A [Paraclostridium bifermentans]
MSQRKRFNINNELEKLYIEIPKALLFEPRYKPNKETGSKGLSNDAKILYGILLDRTYLSIHTATEGNDDKYIDENGDVFIYFENPAIEEILNVANKKAIAVKKELIDFNLLEEVRQGQGKTNRLYLNIVETDKSNLKLYTSSFKNIVKNKKETERVRVEKYRKNNPTTVANTLYCQKDSTSTVKNEVQVLSKRQSSNTDFNKTDFNEPEKVVVIYSHDSKEKSIEEKIKKLIGTNKINNRTYALIHSLLEADIEVSEKQLFLLDNCAVDIAQKAIETTISQNGKSFSYFYKVYKAFEKEDIDNMCWNW